MAPERVFARGPHRFYSDLSRDPIFEKIVKGPFGSKIRKARKEFISSLCDLGLESVAQIYPRGGAIKVISFIPYHPPRTYSSALSVHVMREPLRPL